MASRGRGANRPAGRSGPRPPGIDGLARAVAVLPVFHCREGSVGPRLESATVERRKESRSHREGPRLTSAGVAPRTRDRSPRVRLSALHPPLRRGDGIAAVATAAGAKALVARRRTRKRKAHAKRRTTRAQQRAAGTKKTALFDIVNTGTSNGSLRAPRLRTRCAQLALSCPGRAPRVRAVRGPRINSARPGTQGVTAR